MIFKIINHHKDKGWSRCWVNSISKSRSWSRSWSGYLSWSRDCSWSMSWSLHYDWSWLRIPDWSYSLFNWFNGGAWYSANLVRVDVGKMILGIIFTKVKLGSIIIPDLLRKCFSVFSLQTNDWKAWYVDFLTRVVVYWGKNMNVCIKSISDNYCWSAGRSTSVYFRRQITTSNVWGRGWFCSWSIFRPCSFQQRLFNLLQELKSEQTAWQETYIFLSLENK